MDFDMLNDFTADSRELLDEVEPDLIGLWDSCQEQHGAMNADTLNRIFRLFHSLKGSAGFLNLTSLVGVAHEAETILAQCRSGELQLSAEHINLLCQAVDLIRSMLHTLDSGAGEEPHERECAEMVRKLKALPSTSGAPMEEPVSSSAEETPQEEAEAPEEETESHQVGIVITEEMIQSFVQETDDSLKLIEASLLILAQLQDEESLHEAFRCFHSIKGNAGFLGYKDIGKLAHQAEDALETIADKGQTLSEKSCDTLLEVVDVLRQALASVQEGSKGNIPDLSQHIKAIHASMSNSGSSEVKPVSAAPEPRLEAVPKVIPEATSPKPQESVSNPQNQPEAPKQERSLPAKQEDKAPARSIRQVQRRDIRVDLEKLDMLINLVGELVIAESMVVNNPDLEGHEFENFEKASRHLMKISRDLQEVALAIRMVPLAGTFKKMVRLVHDLAVKTSKKIDLEIRGEETEIDKTLVESISDPLVHLIRNSADHGIESPQERLKAGKKEVGTIRLEARHEEGEVFVIVADDGKGLDAHKIHKKAVEKGIVAETQELTEKEMLQLIFEPGFSTAEKLSDISGRGVGLDVLRKNIEKLKGSVVVRSKPGLGCTFIMRIPLTLAIIEGMLVKAGSRHYTIPLLNIRESLKARQEMITESVDGREMIHLRGEILPVVRLHEMHEIPNALEELTKGILVILESPHGNYGLLVDQVLGQQQTVIKPLSSYIGALKGVSGCTIMGNGDISLILDISSLVSQEDMEEAHEATA